MRILLAIQSFGFWLLSLGMPLITRAAIGEKKPVEIPQIGVETERDVVKIVTNVANVIAAVTFGVAIIMIIMAAWGYLTAGGDSEKVSTAHNRLIYGIVGIAVALFAFVAGRLVTSFLGGTAPSPGLTPT